MEETCPTIQLIAASMAFVRPYVEAALPGYRLTDAAGADHVVVLCDPAELDMYACKYPAAAVIGAPNVIGTGMTGWPMELAARVWRGTFVHLRGAEPVPVSTVHATDVARAVALTLGRPGRYVVTDCADHTLDELADALADRLDGKRIFTAPRRWGRWLPGYTFRRESAARPVYDGAPFASEFGLNPVNVSTYLRTHVYDESSL